MHLMSLLRPTFIAKFNCTPFFNKWANDNLLATFFFVLGGSIALIFYQKIGYTFFYQNFAPEAILWACGFDFAHPRITVTELIPFLNGDIKTFACEKLSQPLLHETTSVFTKGQPYLPWSAALLWKWFGVSYSSLNFLVFLLWGSYVAGIYLLFRQFNTELSSIFGALFITLSPVMIHMIGNLRDFSKAPFIIWSLYFLIRTIKSSHIKIFNPIMAGLIAGLGLGFRSDLFFLLPIGFLFLLIGATDAQHNYSLKSISAKVKNSIIFALTFLFFASPVLINKNTNQNGNTNFGGLAGLFAIQGMTEPFRAALKLSPAGYQTGWAYSDELTLSGLAAQDRTFNPKQDETELMGTPGITVSSINFIGTKDLIYRGDLFLGDFTNQAIKSIYWIVSLPIYMENVGAKIAPHFESLTPQKLIASFYAFQHKYVILPFLFLGILTLIVSSFLKSKDEGIALTFLLLFLCAYPAIQFDLRHFFHLEFIWVLSLLSLHKLPDAIKKLQGKFQRFITTIITITLIFLITYWMIIQYQKKTLHNEIIRLMHIPRSSVSLEDSIIKDGKITYFVPVPNKFRQLVNSKYDSMTPEIAYKGGQWDIRAAAERYYLSIYGERCASEKIPITLNYRHTDGTWQALDTTLILDQHHTNLEAGVVFPGFYRPSQYFESISIPQKFSVCHVKLEKINGESRIPIVFTATIVNNNLYGESLKALGQFKVRP